MNRILSSCRILCGWALVCAGLCATIPALAAPRSAGDLAFDEEAHCTRRTAPPSAGEQAFAAHDLPKAETLLREEATATGPDADRAHNALVRTLIRESKVSEAESNAHAWATASPQNVWAQLSVAETQWRKGELKEAIDTLNLASKLDGCNARLHADLSRLQSFSGKMATAKVQIDYAHFLDPVDEDIANRWINLQPRAKRLENLNAYIAHAGPLSPEDKTRLERMRDRLQGPTSGQACRLVSSTTSASIPFRRIQDGPNAAIFWGLEVYFNGKQRRLEIDTGAHGLLLTRAAADALHLPAGEKTKVFGVGDEGAASSHISQVKSIKIGGLEFADCDVEVLDADRDVLNSPDGLIGGDVFSSFVLTLDFPGHTLKLDPLPIPPGAAADENTPSLATSGNEDEPLHDPYIDPSMKNWTKVFRSGHDLILPIRVNGGPIRLFIVDTGARLDSITPEVAKEVGRNLAGSFVDMYGISGKVNKTYRTGPLNLDFAGLRYPSPGMIAMDNGAMKSAAGVDLAGFLGAETLHSLTVQIDYRDNLMHFVYDPKRVVRCVGQNTGDCN